MTDIWNNFLVHPLMALALLMYSAVKDFGLAIILVTVLIRLIVYPLYKTQIRSQRAMQELAPAMSELKRKHGKDRQRFAEEQMKLYKEHGVNPAAGCLPLLLQLPILFALYSALLQLGCGLGSSGGENCPGLSFDAAQSLLGPLAAFVPNPVPSGGTLDTTANWLPWLTGGLQHPDRLYILPVLAGLFQLIASVMAMPAKQVVTDDPNQRMFQSMAYTFPLMTVVLGAQFPAGLTLYWIATTVFQIVQQYFVSGWGQLTRWLPFLKNVPTPADKVMKRETAAIIREGERDLERSKESGRAANDDGAPNGEDENGDEAAATGRGQGRRRGRRRGRR